MHIEKRNCSKRSIFAKRSLLFFLSVMLSFSMLFALTIEISVAATPSINIKTPPITMSKYQAIKMEMTKADIHTLLEEKAISGTPVDSAIYKAASNDPYGIEWVKIVFDNTSKLVCKKEIKYAFEKTKNTNTDHKTSFDTYAYYGEATKLMVPSHISVSVKLPITCLFFTKTHRT